MKTESSGGHLIWSFVITAALALVLGGCGGGSTGGTDAGTTAPDTTDPAIVSSNILPNAVNVPTNTKISFTFDEPIQNCNSCITLNPTSGVQVSAVTGVSNVSGSTIEFTLNSELAPDTQYAVYVVNITDYSANIFAGSSSSQAAITFTTASILDLTPPTVTSHNETYLPGSTLVALDSNFAVLFSEAMDAASIDSTTFSISDLSNNKINGVVAYSGDTATFTPNALLNPGTKYNATITAGVKDVAGNTMSTDYSWQFSTGAITNNLSHVVSTYPANNASEVDIGSHITVRFDRYAYKGVHFKISASCPLSGTTTFDDVTTHTATFSPFSTLLANSTCNVVVSGMVDHLNGYIPSYSWSFTTGSAPIPTPAPTPTFNVTGTSPASGSTNISVASKITVQLSGNLGTFSPTSISVSPAVAGTILGSSGYKFLVFTPAASLASSTTYTVTVSGVKDYAGTPLTANYTWSFTTAPPILPQVVSTSDAPVGGTSFPIRAAFNKLLDVATCTPETFTVSGGVTGTVTCSGNSINFTPSVPLSLSTSYTATINTGIKDYEGLSLANNYSWIFNTRTEYDAPTVMGASHNATGVNVEFSEVMNPSSINSTTFNLSPAAAGTVTSSGAGATFNPSSPLAKDTAYTVTISGAKDSAGNTLAANYIWTFLTDPGNVVPFEAYGGNCFGTTPFGVYAQNQTAYNQDITICVHNAATGNPSCQTFPNIAPNQYTFHSYVTTANAYIGSVSVCYSSGQYTVSWVKTGGPTTSARTDTFTSTTYAPTSPTVDPCLHGAIACVPKITVAPVVSDTTSTTSTTYPPVSLTPPTSPDADGCYVPQHNPECLEVEKSTLSTSNYQIIRLRNNCTQRVYAEICNQHINGTWDCGADGASPGGATSYWTYDANGKYKYQYTGSTQWMSDWVCAGRDPNWSMNFEK